MEFIFINKYTLKLRKIYHLSTCSTCQRIIKTLALGHKDFEFIDIKVQNISESDLDKAAETVGSFENVFSKRALKFRGMGLHNLDLSEDDYKRHILEEYTFLKRPVIFIDEDIFVGNSKKVIEQARVKLKE